MEQVVGDVRGELESESNVDDVDSGDKPYKTEWPKLPEEDLPKPFIGKNLVFIIILAVLTIFLAIFG
jgi:hypothetical protein